jgi:hypothetical protein
MNRIRPYLFWYIAGAIAVVSLGWMLFFPPVAEDGSDAVQVKESLDGKSTDWEALTRRAQLTLSIDQRGPRAPVDPEKDERNKLASDYLVTKNWGPVLTAQIGRYDEQLGRIRAWLAQRSAALHAPVLDTQRQQEWYDEYERATAALVDAQIAAGRFTPSAAEDTRTSTSIRTAFALYTRGSDLPTEAEWPRLSYRLRILEAVLNRLAGVRAATIANPVVAALTPAGDAAEGLVARIVSVEIEDVNAPLGSGVDQYAVGHAITVELRGAVPALTAAMAACEQAGDASQPILVVTGGRLARRESFEVGERKDVTHEVAEARINLLLLDFHDRAVTAGGAP